MSRYRPRPIPAAERAERDARAARMVSVALLCGHLTLVEPETAMFVSSRKVTALPCSSCGYDKVVPTIASEVGKPAVGFLADVVLKVAGRKLRPAPGQRSDGTGPRRVNMTLTENSSATSNAVLASRAEGRRSGEVRAGIDTWEHHLTARFTAALAEDDPQRLRNALIELAATAAEWGDAIDARAKEGAA